MLVPDAGQCGQTQGTDLLADLGAFESRPVFCGKLDGSGGVASSLEVSNLRVRPVFQADTATRI